VIARIVSLVVLLGVVGGCTPEEPEARPSSKPPTPTTTTPTSSTPPPTAPPPLTRRLDPSRYATEGTVCDLLPDAQAIELGLPSPGSPDNVDEMLNACTRHHTLADHRVEYNLWIGYDVLGSSFGRFEPEKLHIRDIAGQPAVLVGADPTEFCQVDLGLAERKGIEVMAEDHSDEKKACALAVTIAERMVGNLTGGG